LVNTYQGLIETILERRLFSPRMWIVRLALRHPYTFLVISVLLVALGLAADSVAPSSASVIVETAEAKHDLRGGRAAQPPSRQCAPQVPSIPQHLPSARKYKCRPGTRFVTNPTDTLRDGALVRIDAPEPTKIAT